MFNVSAYMTSSVSRVCCVRVPGIYMPPKIPAAHIAISKIGASYSSKSLYRKAYLRNFSTWKDIERGIISESKEKKVLTTPRTLSRPIRCSDYNTILPIFTDPIAMAHLPQSGGEIGAERFIENHMKLFEKYGHSMNICFSKDEETFVGLSGLTPMEGLNGKFEIELGYLIRRELWGKGFATELGIAYLDYANNVMGCKDVISLIPINHVVSESVALKLGFYFESTVEYMGDKYSIFRKILSLL